jgi:hypothetical protein
MSRASVEEGYFRHALRSILNNLDSTISSFFFLWADIASTKLRGAIQDTFAYIRS